MKQTFGLLKNKTHILNFFKQNLQLKTNPNQTLSQSNPLSIQKSLIQESNSLLLNSQNKSKVLNDQIIEMQPTVNRLSSEWALYYYNTVENIKLIKEIKKELQILSTKRLKIQFGDTNQIDQQIYQKNQKATTILLECEKNTQKIEKYQNKLESFSEQIIRQNINKALTQQISELANQLRNQQKRFITTLKSIGQINQQNFIFSNEGKTIELQDNNNLTQHEEQLYDQIVQDKDQNITLLVQMINELAVVFQSLNQLVLDQGHLLDRIDENIENAYKNIKKANLELKKKSEHIQNSPYANRIIIILVGLIVFCSMLLVIKYTR